MTVESPGRRVLVLAHTGRAEVREVARACVKSLTYHGIAVRLLPLHALAGDQPRLSPRLIEHRTLFQPLHIRLKLR